MDIVFRAVVCSSKRRETLQNQNKTVLQMMFQQARPAQNTQVHPRAAAAFST
jgi:hypothetical protein